MLKKSQIFGEGENLKRGMRKIFKTFMAFILSIGLVFSYCMPVFATDDSDTDTNEISVTLYFPDNLELPEGFNSSYQVQFAEGTDLSTLNCRIIRGNSATIDENGLISIGTTTWYYAGGFWTTVYIEGAPTRVDYNSGSTTILVTTNLESILINVEVESYDNHYAENKLQSVYDEITADDSLQGVELAEAFVKYIADTTSYSGSYSSLNDILTTNSGDCWASVAYFNALCEMAGIDVRTRNATQDSGAGSGHRNSIVKIDGKYYIADVGFSGTAPRHYSFYEEPSGLYVRNGTLIQYDAFDVTDAVIPSEINGSTITDIGADYLDRTVFGLYDGLTSVTLPETINYISDVAFNSCPDLENIYVDEENTSYYDVDGVLYSYDDRLIKVPETRSEVVIEPGTTSIEDFAFYGTGRISITIPSSVTTPFTEWTFNSCTPTIYAEEDSYAATYAAEHGLTFVATHLDHTAGEPQRENYVAPTCTKDGHYDSVIRCTECGESMFSSRVTIQATGHTAGDAQHENEVAPTCTVDGSYDEVIRCTVCGDVISSNRISVDATGHTSGEPVQEVTKAPTCEESGTYDMVTYCNVCGDEIDRVSDPSYVIKPTGHTEGEPVKENEVEATCTKDGSYDEVVYCTICERELSRKHNIIKSTGHTPNDPVRENIHRPSCDQEGSYDEVVYCGICGDELSRTNHRIDPSAHTPAEAVKENIVEPTCTMEGSYDEVVYCLECHNVISSNHVTIEPKGHTPDEETEMTDIVEPTCTESGSYVEITYCADCGIELNRKTINVDPTGHPENNYEIRNATAPTCTAMGYSGDTYCGICGELVARGENIDMIPHNFVDDFCTECGVYNYRITDESINWITGSNESLVINTNGDEDTLLAIYVDGKLLDEDAYTISGENVSIELGVAFLRSLATGTHTIEVQWEAGTAVFDFVVNPEQTVDDNTGTVEELPATDTSNTQNSNTSSSNINDSKNESTNAVDTGDDMFATYSLFGLLLSGVFIAYFGRKKRQI